MWFYSLLTQKRKPSDNLQPSYSSHFKSTRWVEAYRFLWLLKWIHQEIYISFSGFPYCNFVHRNQTTWLSRSPRICRSQFFEIMTETKHLKPFLRLLDSLRIYVWILANFKNLSIVYFCTIKSSIYPCQDWEIPITCQTDPQSWLDACSYKSFTITSYKLYWKVFFLAGYATI